MIYAILLAIIVIVILIAVIKNRKIKLYDLPPYYKDVWISYCLPDKNFEYVVHAWLSVNDNGEYIWTLSDTNKIIPHDWVTDWWFIS